MNYTVYKYFQNGHKPVMIRSGLSLNQAQKLCNDPETSSITASKPAGCNGNDKTIATWHKNQKHWFYGYTSN